MTQTTGQTTGPTSETINQTARTNGQADPAGMPDPSATRPGRGGVRGAWRLVARREVVVKVRDRAFLIGTLVTLVILAGTIGVQGYLNARTTDIHLGVTSTAARDLGDVMTTRAPQLDEKVSVDVVDEPSDARARAAVESGDLDGWLHQEGGTWTLTTRDEADSKVKTLVETVVREQALAANAASAGTSVTELNQGSTVTLTQLRGDVAQSQLNEALAFVFAFLFYIAALTFGLTLASSVVEEKQSRIVEIIAAAIPLRQLLAGKVVGNTLMAAAQMGLYIVVGVVGLSFTEYSSLLPGLSGSMAWFLVFFVAGFVALSCLWAVAGALASRSEDLQSTSTPVTMLVMVMFFGALFLDGTAQTVLSYVPPVSAILMPIRILDGSAAWWEPVVAMVVLISFAALMIRLGERVYRRALLQTGGKLGLKTAWNLEE